MSTPRLTAAFLWRFLDDVWDLLPTEDRQLFETYWSALVQISANLETKVIEASLSPIVETVPVYLTERWNRFVMDDSSCDLLAKTDSLVLTSTTPMAFGAGTVLYPTLSLSNAVGAIDYTETMEFFDDSIRSLRYGGILANTVSVRIASFVYLEGHDYVVNYVSGTVQALPGGRIPINQVATVRYSHAKYKRGLDFIVDELKGTVARIAGTTINSGDTVVAAYTYNTTPTIPLQSTAGVVPVGLASLVDNGQDFSGLLPNRILTVLSGPNAGTYQVTGIVASNEISVLPSFPVAQLDGGVRYTINAFPHGQRVAANIASIPALQDLVDTPNLVLREGVDYVVSNGILASRAFFPLMTIGPTESRTSAMWAERTLINKETPYRNFGVLIDFYRQNSEVYKQALQGLWYTFWTGSTTGNLQRGLQILLGLPYAKAAGTVISLIAPTITTAGSLQIQDSRGQILTYTLPSGLDVTVALGDAVTRFQSLTTGVRIIDGINEPGFVTTRLGREGVSRFLTSKASRGTGDTDETKALSLLEAHLFIPQVLTEALTAVVNVTELTTFLDNMKPQWTEYVFSFDEDIDESFSMDANAEDVQASTSIDCTTMVGSNEENMESSTGNFTISRSTGETTAGSQAAGNFQDLGVDFAAAGVDTGDYIRIANGQFHGYWRVLKRVSAHLLSIDIPDALLVASTGLQYVLLPIELRLGHDAVQLKREHLNLAGTLYSAPTTLNTKTDANFGDLPNSDVQAMLLVDVANAGHEVQVITAARVDLGEITVGTPPSAGAHVHAVSSAAVKVVDNVGGLLAAFPI